MPATTKESFIIDTKCRPPFAELKQSYVFQQETRIRCAKRFQMELPNSFLEGSMEKYIQEMDENNVKRAFVPVRRFSGVFQNSTQETDQDINNVLIKLLETYPNRFFGVPDIDPLGGKKSLTEIEYYSLQPHIHGIALEPGYSFLDVDDARIYPIYQYCQEKRIPIFLSFGGRCQRKLSNLQPLSLDRMLTDFPNLTVIVAHGGWPYVQEMMWNGLLHKNLYLMPDIYMLNIPGSRDFIDAANTLLMNQMVFGSAYPCVSYEYVITYLKKCLTEEAQRKFLYQNAVNALFPDKDNNFLS